MTAGMRHAVAIRAQGGGRVCTIHCRGEIWKEREAGSNDGSGCMDAARKRRERVGWGGLGAAGERREAQSRRTEWK